VRLCRKISHFCRRSKSLLTKNARTSVRSSIYDRKRAIIKEIIELKKMNEWDQFLKTMQEKIREKGIREKLINYFHEESKYIQVWRACFSIFVVFIVYMYFFKHICLQIDDGIEASSSVTKVYYLINIMFAIDFILSIIQLITTSSKFFRLFNLFFIIPIKGVMCVPFTLIPSNIIFISFKFLRLDLIENLFLLVKNYCYSVINNYIHVSWLKLLMSQLNELFKFLLVFVLYAHFIACIYVKLIKESAQLEQLHFDLEKFYLECLYFTLETFTTIGYGDLIPDSRDSVLLVIVNMYIGVNLFFLITTNIKMLTTRLYFFRKDNQFRILFQKFLFRLQKNKKKLLPNKIKNALYSFHVLKRGLSLPQIFDEYNKLFKICRNDIKGEISLKLFDNFYKEYSLFFNGCSKTFINKVFSKLTPKM
jgi:hypothetical protein